MSDIDMQTLIDRAYLRGHDEGWIKGFTDGVKRGKADAMRSCDGCEYQGQLTCERPRGKKCEREN